MNEAEIRAKLNEITQLKLDIQKRMEHALSPVYAISDDPHNTTLSITEHAIENRIHTLATEVAMAYSTQSSGSIIQEQIEVDSSPSFPVLLNLMHGALYFASDFQKALHAAGLRFQYETLQVKSYNGTESGEDVILHYLPKVILTNRDIIVVDDVCDTGKTYDKLCEKLSEHCPKSIKLAVLIDKKQDRTVDPDFVGFTIQPSDFIVGYGMDYNELLRDTTLGVAEPSTMITAEEQALLDQESSLSQQLIQIEQSKKASLEVLSTHSVFSFRISDEGDSPTSIQSNTESQYKVSELHASSMIN